jgi:acyl-CoA thioester hydrolase
VIHQIRVIFGDTDQMGVVYYANYLRFFEASRAAYLRALGRSHADLDRMGVALPVVEAHCRYRSPSRYEDLLDIEVHVTEVRGASMRFEYVVRRDDSGTATVIAEGFTRHAVIRPDGRPRSVPDELRALIDRGECG